MFVLDQRNHGLSDPAPTTIGYNEAMDVAAAIRYFRDKYDSVAVWGLSMGAAASVVAAKRGDRPDLLVAEGLYGSLANAVAVRGRDMGVPYFPLIPLALSYYEALSGVDLDEMDMCENIRALSGLPILLVHSAEDSLVPMESFECLKNGLDPKTGRAVLFPEGAHDGIYEANSAEYTSVLTAFVNKHER